MALTPARAFGALRLASPNLPSTLDCAATSSYNGSISGNITFSFSNPPPSGYDYTLKLSIYYSSGTITWPSNILWSGGVPTLTTNKNLLIWLSTVDGGTWWIGSWLST